MVPAGVMYYNPASKERTEISGLLTVEHVPDGWERYQGTTMEGRSLLKDHREVDYRRAGFLAVSRNEVVSKYG